jgi:hypothetical protein
LAAGGNYLSPTTITGFLQAGGGEAVLITTPWSLDITGSIQGNLNSGNLIEAEASTTLDNSGTIANGFSGVNLYAGGSIYNAGQGVISGSQYAINAYAAGQNPANGIFFDVSNAGTLTAGGVGIFGGNGFVSNTSTGTISAGFFGILDVTTIANSGYIRGQGFVGAGLNAGGALTNTAGATIIGGIIGVYATADRDSEITNAGYILGGSGYGVKFGTGSLTNTRTGTISGGKNGVYLAHYSSLTNAGLIQGADYGSTGITLSQGGLITNTGTIIATTGIQINSGTITNSGLIEGESLSGITGLSAPSADAIALNFTAPGNFTENATGIVLGSILGDGGTLTLNGGSLAQVYGFAEDVFGSHAHATLSTALSGLGTIAGFSKGDTLALTNQSATSGIFLGHSLTLSNGAHIAFAGTYAANAFTVTAEPDGSTEITGNNIPCFLAGTRIATARGETPVENLEIGDLVQTLHAGLRPVKWIGTRAYAAPFANNPNILPIHIRPGALGWKTPARDLFVSPGHAIFTSGVLIPAARLINGSSITQLTQADSVHYFHIELETHDILLAESCPAESFLAQSSEQGSHRAQFHNAAEFDHLYPNAPSTPGLPRLEHGFLLAGLPHIPQPKIPGGGLRGGGLRGFIDQLGPDTVSGWAQHIAAAETPVILDILSAGRRLARLPANEFRADLRTAGFGSGNHAFSFQLPPGLTTQITVRRACDHARLTPTKSARAA